MAGFKLCGGRGRGRCWGKGCVFACVGKLLKSVGGCTGRGGRMDGRGGQ